MPTTDTDDQLDKLLEELQAIVATGDQPVATAPDLADRVDRDRRRVHEDLKILRRLDLVDTLDVGSRARVWWPTPHPWHIPRDDQRPHSARSGDAMTDTPPNAERREQRDDLPADQLVDDVDQDDVELDLVPNDQIMQLLEEIPGSGDTLEARRDQLLELYQHLRAEGSASRSDFLELVDADRVGYSSAGSYWSNVVKGRDTLRALPGVDAPGEGEHRWRYRDN